VGLPRRLPLALGNLVHANWRLPLLLGPKTFCLRHFLDHRVCSMPHFNARILRLVPEGQYCDLGRLDCAVCSAAIGITLGYCMTKAQRTGTAVLAAWGGFMLGMTVDEVFLYNH